MNDVHFQIHFLSIHSMLSWIMKVELHGSSNEILKTWMFLCVFFKQLNDGTGEEVFSEIQSYLERGSCPDIFVSISVVRIVLVLELIILKFHSHKLALIRLRVKCFKLLARSKQSYRCLLLPNIRSSPLFVLCAPISSMFIIVERLESLMQIVIPILTFRRWTEKSNWTITQSLNYSELLASNLS
jgi:hypothetical protein